MFLGFDFSTQQVKAVVIDSDLSVVKESTVKLDDLGYKTDGGVHRGDDGVTITAPTIMWVEALDVLLAKMHGEDREIFSRVQALGGCGQQHGSVYWKTGSEANLAQLKSSLTLKEQLEESFSVGASPIWMDSSTTAQCRVLEDTVGGAENMAKITGSPPYERFTGLQILKLIQNSPEQYKATERISLVSSFACSLLLGRYSDLDDSDAGGMNLFDITTRDWSPELIKACSQDLSSKLGKPVSTVTKQGVVSPYFVQRYGFPAACEICSFTGDNPASLAGLRLAEGSVAVSLGSSDTVFLSLKNPQPGLEGVVLVNPINTEDYLAMIVFKNGSFTREHIRDKHAQDNWDVFVEKLQSTEPGNSGQIGFYFTECEIAPRNITGCYYFNENDERLDDFTDEAHVRAVIEGQFLSRRVHAEEMGFQMGEGQVLATGGASNNAAILQVLSDVFSAPVYTIDISNSAALGGAYLAMQCHYGSSDGLSFHERTAGGPPYKLAAEPRAQYEEVYNKLAARYKALESRLVSEKK